jgi:hypothetical protein
MSFLRNPGWVGSLHQPVTSSAPGTWTQTNVEDFSTGVVNTAFGSTIPNIVSSGDYGFIGRVQQDWAGRPGKTIRFGTQAEIGGSNNSRYRCYLYADNTYLNNNLMSTEGRITHDVYIPINPAFRGQGGADPQVWWFSGITDGVSRFIFFGFELNTQTLGLWNSTTGNFTTLAATTTLALGGTPAPGWYTVDFRYKLAAVGGYAWVQFNGLTPLSITGANTSRTDPLFLYALACPSSSFVNSDTAYFGQVGTVRWFRPS